MVFKYFSHGAFELGSAHPKTVFVFFVLCGLRERNAPPFEAPGRSKIGSESRWRHSLLKKNILAWHHTEI